MMDFDFTAGSRDLSEGDVAAVLGKIKAVAFDLDGTITDSIGNILRCTHFAFDYMHLPQPTDLDIMKTIGLELQDGLAFLLPPDKKSRSAEVTAEYRRIFKEHDEFMIDTLFPNLPTVFQGLRERGLKIGYASGRSVVGMMRTISSTFIKDYCDGICGGDEVPSKPAPQMMEVLCRRLGVKTCETLVIGDAGLDIKLGKNAGCYTLGVQTGVWSGSALKTLHPDLLLPRVSDLAVYL